MENKIHLTTVDDKSDYIDLHIRMLRNMDFFKKRISNRKYSIPLYSLLIIGLLFLLFLAEYNIFINILLFISIYLLYYEIFLERNLLKKTKKIYSKEINFDNKTTEYTITKEYIESVCDFQTLKFSWNDLTNYKEKPEELELDFYKKGMIVFRKKSFKNQDDFHNLLKDLKLILKDHSLAKEFGQLA
ncbi:hypothetical protein AB3N60_14825 [Leptospira sp. WS39.C2]